MIISLLCFSAFIARTLAAQDSLTERPWDKLAMVAQCLHLQQFLQPSLMQPMQQPMQPMQPQGWAFGPTPSPAAAAGPSSGTAAGPSSALASGTGNSGGALGLEGWAMRATELCSVVGLAYEIEKHSGCTLARWACCAASRHAMLCWDMLCHAVPMLCHALVLPRSLCYVCYAVLCCTAPCPCCAPCCAMAMLCHALSHAVLCCASHVAGLSCGCWMHPPASPPSQCCCPTPALGRLSLWWRRRQPGLGHSARLSG